ncbi:hypothetical protein MHYP_G00090840 [Metynnis hypsauchen]
MAESRGAQHQHRHVRPRGAEEEGEAEAAPTFHRGGFSERDFMDGLDNGPTHTAERRVGLRKTPGGGGRTNIYGTYASHRSRKHNPRSLCDFKDNLCAHSIGGFVESFSSSHFCRFCLGERSQFQVTKLSTVDLSVLKEDVKEALERKFPV